ncbi:uncharacterized protein [Salminus brasiliensis]
MGDFGKTDRALLGLCVWMIVSFDRVASLRIEVLDAEQIQDESMLGRLQRKLLIEDEGYAEPSGNGSNTRMSETQSSSPWPILVGLLLSVLSVAFVIMLVVKYRIIQRFFRGYSEALLPEGDTASQFSHSGTLTDNFPAQGMRNREVYTVSHEEDDDGFIEDNYISSGDKERAAREAEQVEVTDEDSDDELDIHFSIE